MKTTFPLIILLLITLGCASQPSEYVDIPDESLAKFIRAELGLVEFDPIPIDSLKELTELTIGLGKTRGKKSKWLTICYRVKVINYSEWL